MSGMARRILSKAKRVLARVPFSSPHAGIDEECGIVGKG